MRRRSPSYSPPRRGYGGRDRSPPRGRYGGYRDAPCGLLVRNIPKGSRPEDLRVPFEQFGRVRDVYLPRDFHTGEPRGFGFVQFLNPFDAAEAKKYMDRRMFNGREIMVVFAEENRKKPEEMRMKERGRGRMGYDGRRSPDHGYTPPRYRSPSPRKGRYSRSNDGSPRRGRYGSISPDAHRKDRDHSPNGFLDASPADVRQGKIDRNCGRHSISSRRSYSPDEQTKSPSKQERLRSPSPLPQSQRYSRSPARESRSRSRSKSWRRSRSSPSIDSPPPRRQRHVSTSRSPRSHSPPPKRQRNSTHSNHRDLPQGKKIYSSLTPEERTSRGESLSPQ